MKKIVLLTVLISSLISNANVAKKDEFKPVLLSTVEMTTFSDLSKKTMVLGTLFNNPMISTMILTSLQQAAELQYGRVRTDSPITAYVYQTSPIKKDKDAKDGFFDCAVCVIYPSAEKPNTFVMSRPGATKGADGVIEIPETVDKPKSYVVYSADKKFSAHCENLNIAKKAIADFSLSHKAHNVFSEILKAEMFTPAIDLLANLYEMNGNDECGKAALISTNRKAEIARLKSFKSISLSFDLGEKGIEIKAVAIRKTAEKNKYKNLALTPDLLNVPEAPSLFFAVNHKYYYENEEVSPEMIGEVLSLIAKNVESKKVQTFINNVIPALKEYTAKYQKANKADKNAEIVWIGTDKDKHIYLASYENSTSLYDESLTLLDKCIAAQNNVWGANSFFVKGKNPGDFTFDVGKLIDIEGVEPGKSVPPEVTIAKGKIKSIVGDTKIYIGVKKVGNGVLEYVSTPGYMPEIGKGNGEKDFLEVIPEAATKRPVAVVYMGFYSFVRDILLPNIAKTASVAERQQYDMMIMTMPKALPKSAIASAVWAEDSKEICLLRVTANELKNLGAVFNVFTAAAMSAGEEQDKKQ